jgi:ubiquinone/menaquinone biosynthesis C-methylase UbiE
MARVMRTLNGQPVTEVEWQRELRYILRFSQVEMKDDVLELCCGNGILTENLATHCRSVVAVDYVQDLILELKRKKLPNVTARSGDIRKLRIPPASFDLVVICAGVQYLTETETVNLLGKIYHWLKPGGRLCLFHVPSNRRLWHYVNTQAKRDLYFKRIRAGRQLVGTWYDKEWFKHLAEFLNYQSVDVRSQPRDQVYSHYRFDVILKK